MVYKDLRICISDLEKHGQLLRIREEVDPDLLMAAIHRRVFTVGGPALLFERVKGSPFPAVSNLFGTMERARFIFRHTMKTLEALLRIGLEPEELIRHPLKNIRWLPALRYTSPKKVRRAAVLGRTTQLSSLPQLRFWPQDGGAFLTLPQVLSIDPEKGDVRHSNLGMYRIQISGNQYQTDLQAGLHYQIHRGIGVHHARAKQRGEKMRVSIFLGGPPAHSMAAVMPLPEAISELMFAGLLAGRRFRYTYWQDWLVSADADFCILATLEDTLLPEGPFGDHLGYYSLQHPFPVLRIHKVFHRPEAIFPFTVVGRPPQEDTVFGKLIHEMTAPLLPRMLPGVKAVHAVDEAGVHPLLLAIGSERYVPYQERTPMELLTQAHAILGFGQLSLAKYLLIVAEEDDPSLSVHDIKAYLRHWLCRIDWRKDLHFVTQTTMDTLDYSGEALNRGSKVIMAAAGPPKRTPAQNPPSGVRLPQGYGPLTMATEGILLIQAPNFVSYEQLKQELQTLSEMIHDRISVQRYPLIVLVDDAAFCTQSMANFLWVTFTRSDPARDIHGVDSFIMDKHWGCRGPLIIDARLKPHHAPPLEEDANIEKKVEQLASPGHSLFGVI